MLVTLEGIVTPVSLVRYENAESPMLVTEYPPKLDGMVIVPEVEDDTAHWESPPIVALPSDTV